MSSFTNQYIVKSDIAYGRTKTGETYIVDAKNVEWLQNEYTCFYNKKSKTICARRKNDNKEFLLSRLVLKIKNNDRRKVIRNDSTCLDYRECNLWVGNKYKLIDDYYEVTCRNGKTFKIDVDDYALVSQYVWHVDVNGYVVSDRNNGEKPIKQHRLIMGILNKPELEVDHIYHDTCDNRKKNLRVVGRSENVQNRRNTSRHGCPGVELVKGYNNLWKVSIRYNGERIYLGCFHSKEDAINKRLSFEKEHNIIRTV